MIRKKVSKGTRRKTHERYSEYIDVSCAHKVKYKREEWAYEVLALMEEQRVTGWQTLAVYPCRFCSSYHIGHANPEGASGRYLDIQKDEFYKRIELEEEMAR